MQENDHNSAPSPSRTWLKNNIYKNKSFACLLASNKKKVDRKKNNSSPSDANDQNICEVDAKSVKSDQWFKSFPTTDLLSVHLKTADTLEYNEADNLELDDGEVDNEVDNLEHDEVDNLIDNESDNMKDGKVNSIIGVEADNLDNNFSDCNTIQETENEILLPRENQLANQLIKLEETIDNSSSLSDISKFLESIALLHLNDLFISEDIDLHILRKMTNEDLKEVGVVKFGQRFKILEAIKNFGELCPSQGQKLVQLCICISY